LELDVPETEKKMRDDLAELEARSVAALPSDRALLEELGLAEFYARVYRSGSEHVHFSVKYAIRELRGVDAVDLDSGDHELTDEALRLAIITYAVLFERSERTVEHGLAKQVRDRVRALFEDTT
jgi:hypothetical protein